MRIYSLTNDSGRAVANQFVRDYENGEKVFQSYETDIAHIAMGKVTLTRSWDYSATTTKYLCVFLTNELGCDKLNKAKVKKMIDKGLFKLTNKTEL